MDTSSSEARSVLSALATRIKALEDIERASLAGVVSGGASSPSSLEEENKALKDQVSRLEYRVKFLIRSLEEEEKKSKIEGR